MNNNIVEINENGNPIKQQPTQVLIDNNTNPKPIGGDVLNSIIDNMGNHTIKDGQIVTKESNTNTNTNAYYSIQDALGQQPTMPKSSDTSTGSVAAAGTQYSWDQQGQNMAQNQYQQDVLKAKQDALSNRQTIEQNALQYQQQADMMQYSNNQNAEKVGWTGGYVLDQNRQMEYLKASIQAQMYGAMELQKYGYDSALAAARLSYDLNQQQFAHQYYLDAVTVAANEAQLTGVYFSAETRDMMAQLKAADQELKLTDENGKALSLEKIDEGLRDGSISLTPEQERALEVRRNIEKWYTANGVDTTGVQTLAAWQTETQMMQEWAMNQWTMYQAALSKAENKEAENANIFIALDKEGNPIYDGNKVQTLDFRTMSTDDIKKYLSNTNTAGKEQVFGYVDNLFQEIVNAYIKANTATKSDGTTRLSIYKDTVLDKLKSNDKINALLDVLDNYEYTTELGKSTVTITRTNKGELEIDITDSSDIIKGKTTIPVENQEEYNTQIRNTYENVKNIDNYTDTLSFDEILKISINGSDDEIFEDYLRLEVATKDYNSNLNKIDDDIDITLYWGTAGDGKNYDLDIDWSYPGINLAIKDYAETGSYTIETWNKTQAALSKNYPNQTTDTFAFCAGELWFYDSTNNRWGYVQKTPGGNKLREDLQSAIYGQRAKNWMGWNQ